MTDCDVIVFVSRRPLLSIQGQLRAFSNMYSVHHHINLLTAALLRMNIVHVVVCPGARNAPIVHNFYVHGTFQLHAVTDERSAAFVAIGLQLRVRQPVAVCVTSGSALLNTLPGVAEAAMRNLPLLIISADRPEKFHHILDGQTLPQIDALRPYAPSLQLPDIEHADSEDLACAALNECARRLTRSAPSPVHLNVPIADPLFGFPVPSLPTFRLSDSAPETIAAQAMSSEWCTRICSAHLPVLVIGQYEGEALEAVRRLRKEHKMLVYAETLSNQGDTRMALWLDAHAIAPDVVLHCGGCLVNKNFKQHLRTLPNVKVLRVDGGDECPDTFFQQAEKLKADPEKILTQLAELLPENPQVRAIAEKLSPAAPVALPIEALFVGNSTAVRMINRCLPVTDFPIFGNRGTNGIEGSLSVAAGFSLAATGSVLCIVGDLSFFYDVNALWNKDLDSRLRILLLNNGRGDIFYHLPGLSASPALDPLIAAPHVATAQGIAKSYRCAYLSAAVECFETALDWAIRRLLAFSSEVPVILELFEQSGIPDDGLHNEF